MARAGYIIFERDNHRCVYCGFSPIEGDDVVLTVDHIYPVALGGSDRADNLVTCCDSCNSQKQARPLDEETQRRLIERVRTRNQQRGIPDGLVINLGSTSAEKRSRQRWKMLTAKMLNAVCNRIMEDFSGAASREGAIAQILCLAIDVLPEYSRETGDIEGAEKARQMLFDLAAQVVGSRGPVEFLLGALSERKAIDEWFSGSTIDHLEGLYRQKGWIREQTGGDT